MRLTIKLQQLLDERGMTQKELAALTGIRPAAISEICNNQRTTINRDHLENIAKVLKITEVDQLIRLE